MSEPAAILESNGLGELIDELSTRLIVEGVESLSDHDLHRLRALAELDGHTTFGTAIAALSAMLKKSQSEVPPAELTRRVSEELEHLRSLLEDPALESSQPDQQQTAQQTSAHPVSGPVVPQNLLQEDQGLIVEFITESREHLSNIEGQMLVLEKGSQDADAAETLNAVFRAFHTIKGLAGFLEFASIQSLAHEVETLLDLARNGNIEVTPPIVDVILESTDVMRQELSEVERHLAGHPPSPSQVDAALLERIRSAAKGDFASSQSMPVGKPLEVEQEEIQTREVTTPAEPSAVSPKPSADKETRRPADMKGSQQPATAPQAAPVEVKQPQAAKAEPRKAESPKPEAARPEPAKAADAASVRIDTSKLDQLMDMVGEMVIAQTLIGHSHALKKVTDTRLLSDLTQLARITADVQRITTGMRMVPIGAQFQKTARVVRDLSRRAGKHVIFETTGEDTEVDKTISEEISDPLLHMVRNSVDHGIEMPDERVAAGKDSTARIRLAAYHQSGQIVISISDDGRGLNREKILAKALERGIIQPGAQLTDNEAYLLIFEPGFSTAEKVTDISGRGVGMDVVRRHVQALRGRIDIQSTPGQGTTFFLKLPLTLAIIEGLVVVVGDQRYIAPIFSVKEMFRPTPDMISTVQGSGEMVMVRGGLLPIVRLHRRFNKEPRTSSLVEGTLIVADAEGHQFCLFVDDLIGKQEVVIKSLGQSFQHVVGIAGCAILGDGRVGLILDMHAIFKGKI
jgi:two-component system chemotaxis sensor kinase CheA